MTPVPNPEVLLAITTPNKGQSPTHAEAVPPGNGDFSSILRALEGQTEIDNTELDLTEMDALREVDTNDELTDTRSNNRHPSPEDNPARNTPTVAKTLPSPVIAGDSQTTESQVGEIKMPLDALPDPMTGRAPSSEENGLLRNAKSRSELTTFSTVQAQSDPTIQPESTSKEANVPSSEHGRQNILLNQDGNSKVLSAAFVGNSERVGMPKFPEISHSNIATRPGANLPDTTVDTLGKIAANPIQNSNRTSTKQQTEPVKKEQFVWGDDFSTDHADTDARRYDITKLPQTSSGSSSISETNHPQLVHAQQKMSHPVFITEHMKTSSESEQALPSLLPTVQAQTQIHGSTVPTHHTQWNSSLSAHAPRLDSMVIDVSTSPNQLEVTLKPEELGRLTLRLETTQMGTQVLISAERSDTQDLARRHLEMLQAHLKEMGFEDLSFTFTQGEQTWDDGANEDSSTPHEHPQHAVNTSVLSHWTLGATSGLDIKV